MHYSMLIQGSPTNGKFEWINPYKYRNPTIISITVLFKHNSVMFNNVDTINVVTNSGGEEMTIPTGFYSIGEIVVFLNTMNNTTFSISTMATSYGCIWIQSQHSIHFTNAPDIREILRLGGQTIVLPASFYGLNVIDIT